MADTAPKKRVRRTAEEARRLILDAAEERLAQGGPEALRLQDIAADVGTSHPAILHHFESRDGLVLALTLRIVENLRTNLVSALDETNVRELDASDIISRVFEVLADRGLARLLAWIMLAGPASAPDAVRDLGTDQALQDIVGAIHEMRVKASADLGVPVPAREDTIFVVYMAAATSIGEAIVGNNVMVGLGPDDVEGAQARFRKWFARLIEWHLVLSAMPGMSPSDFTADLFEGQDDNSTD